MAVYSERHFVEELKKNPNFSKKNYQVALKETCF